MKLIHKLSILALAAVSILALVQVGDPHQAVKEINEFRNKALSAARESGKTLDFEGLQKELADKAKAAVKGVDAKKVEPKQGFAWATLFSMAGMHQEACDAATRYLTSNPNPDEKFQAQSLMMRSCNELGEGHMLAMMLVQVNPPTPIAGISLARTIAGVYVDTIHSKVGLEEALKALDRAEALIPTADQLPENQKALVNGAKAAIAQTRAEVLTEAGKTEEAAAAFDKGIASLPEGDPNLRTLKAGKLRMGMMKKPAPALSIERGHGSFAGLEALRGKVVIIDFFAHWCGPCIASFPDMKKLYADLQPKGLEIVGVTTYYGYYKKERPIEKDAEFGKMAEFIAEHQLPWPVVYGERTNFEAYGVTGIPHVTVIDREGNVAEIKIGYSAQSFAKFREAVEKLVEGK